MSSGYSLFYQMLRQSFFAQNFKSLSPYHIRIVIATFLLIFYLVCLPELSYGQSWNWSNKGGGSGDDQAIAIAVDGNFSYTSGYFQSTMSFTLAASSVTSLTSINGSDVFVAKCDNNDNGKVIWAKSFGGLDEDMGVSIAVDNTGVYVAGMFSNSLDLGNDVNGNHVTLSHHPTQTFLGGMSEGIFLVKYDKSGVLQWARGASGDDSFWPAVVGVDNVGNVYLTGGYFGKSVAFSSTGVSFDLPLTHLVNSEHMFLVKYNSVGVGQWIKGSKDDDFIAAGSCIAFDPSSNSVYVLGSFNSSSISFGNKSVKNVNQHTANDLADTYVVQYDANDGSAKSAFGIGGSGEDFGTTLGFDNNGNLYVAGIFNSPQICFDNNNQHCQSRPPTSDFGDLFDIFVVSYDITHQQKMRWSKVVGNHGDDRVCGALDGVGNFYLSGFFSSSSPYLNTPTQGGTDLFVVKYDNLGTSSGLADVGGSGDDFGNGLALDNSGNVYVTGSFGPTNIAFGNTSPLINSGQSGGDIFIAKLSTAQLTSPILPPPFVRHGSKNK